MTASVPTRRIAVDPERPDPRVIAEAAEVIGRGGLVAFATETVYGLGADALNPAAVAAIFAAKGRPSFNPLIVHAADLAMARTCVSTWPEWATRLAGRFWPGPLTLVLDRAPGVPDATTAGLSTVGVRMPATGVARALIRASGVPIAAPSANRSNRLSPTRAEHVQLDLDGRVDLILDSGPTSVGLESTVVAFDLDAIRILRPGPIVAAELREALPGVVVHDFESNATADRPASPGQLAVHYAPRAPAIRVKHPAEIPSDRSSGDRVLLFGDAPAPNLDPAADAGVVRLATPATAARELYAALHRFDLTGAMRIWVVMPPAGADWDAVRDRLRRATREAPG